MVKQSRLVMVGNGMAGVRTLEELLKIAPDLYDITVFGAEPHPNYNRILLSPVLAGEQTVDEIVLNDWSWYQEHGIALHAGHTVTAVDRARRLVHARGPGGEAVSAPYDRLILATGSNPFMLPIPGKDLAGVLAYRDIADTQAMIDAAAKYRSAVVIGGGLLGLEAANGLMKRGMQVTVVHAGEWLMERQLDPVAGRMLQKALQERGMRFLMQAQTQELLGDGDGRVRAVRFKDGSEAPADLVVMAVGIRPNTALAESMRLHVERGIVVHDTLQTTTDARIYAVGECAAHRGVAYGLVAPLFEQAKVLANHLAEFGIGRYLGSQTIDQAQGHGHRPVLGGRLPGRRRHRGDRHERPRRRALQEAGAQGRQAGGRLPVRQHRGRRLVLQAAARRPGRGRHPRQAHVRREQHRRRRPRRPEPGRRHARRGRGLRLQRRDQGRHLQGHQGKGPVHPGRGAQAHQGQRQLRLVHRPGGADPHGHRRRRLLRHAEDEAPVRLHRARPPGRARRDPHQSSAAARRRSSPSWSGRRPTAARAAARPSTTT
ncbi:nitrite reductase (NAD(P)H), large subunit [Alicycliphilus sp. B1]|nr:nitrite reductase (NAD(P)H), large subunit [Alicycliphilus sp. B1]